MRLKVFVPDPDSSFATFFARGSAIVGEMTAAGWDVCYEGNLYGAVNMNKFVERLLVAAGRYAHDAPTSARAVVPLKNLLIIGTWDTLNQEFQFEVPEVSRTWLVRWLGYTPAEDEFFLWTGPHRG